MTDGRQEGLRRRIADDLEEIVDRHHDTLDEWEIDAIRSAVETLRVDHPRDPGDAAGR